MVFGTRVCEVMGAWDYSTCSLRWVEWDNKFYIIVVVCYNFFLLFQFD